MVLSKSLVVYVRFHELDVRALAMQKGNIRKEFWTKETSIEVQCVI
jgi:hypothetical protein